MVSINWMEERFGREEEIENNQGMYGNVETNIIRGEDWCCGITKKIHKYGILLLIAELELESNYLLSYP